MNAIVKNPAKLIDGVKLNLGGVEYVIPPLSLGAVRRLMPKIEKLTGNVDITAMSGELLDAIAEIICAAMQRNYPDMTQEKVLDVLDMKNMGQVIGAVLGQSGFDKKVGGAASGEVLASQ